VISYAVISDIYIYIYACVVLACLANRMRGNSMTVSLLTMRDAELRVSLRNHSAAAAVAAAAADAGGGAGLRPSAPSLLNLIYEYFLGGGAAMPSDGEQAPRPAQLTHTLPRSLN
jgi:hypothetical protein